MSVASLPADSLQEHLLCIAIVIVTCVSHSVRLYVRARCYTAHTMSTLIWSIVCLFFSGHVNSQQKYPVTFEDALLMRFAPESFNGTWISS